jgi:serine/threonine protein kinase
MVSQLFQHRLNWMDPHVCLLCALPVWALGITLYCMRSGFLPFRYDNPLDLFEAIKHERFVPLLLLNLAYSPRCFQLAHCVVRSCRILFPPHFTGAGRDIIERLLERDPEKRITIDEIRVGPISFLCYSVGRSRSR